MKVIACVVVIFLVAVVMMTGRSNAFSPGFKSIVTQSGLDYATTVGLLILQEKLKTITVPDQSGDKDSLSWQITDIVLTGLAIPSGAVAIDPSVGLNVDISGVSGQINANWHFREDIWPHPSGSGQAQINIGATTIAAVIAVSEASGHPTVSAQSVAVNIGSMDLHFSGSHLDIILNLLKDLFSGQIKSETEKQVTNAVAKEIDTTLNNELATMNIDVKIGSVAELDLSLVAPISFPSTSYMMLPEHGEFYQQSNPVEAPFTPTNLPSTPGTSQMLQMYVDQYVPNTASWVFWKAGKMDITITASQVPPDSPIQFNTSSWNQLVPALYQHYPNWLMQAKLYPLASPTVSFATTGAVAFGEGAIEIDVISPTNGSIIPAFTLGINITADGTAKVVGQNITGNLTYISNSVWLISSDIGQFNTQNLKALVEFVTLVVIMPYFNSYLKIGIPIPSVDGFSIVNPTLTFNNGYLFVSGNVNYQQPFGNVIV